MERALHGTKFIASCIDAMGDMVRVVTGDGKVLLSNPAFKRDMGNFPAETCYNALGQKCRCKPCITRNVLQKGRIQKQTRKVNGKVYSVTASPLLDETGKPFAVIEAFRDITDDFILKQQLIESNEKMHKDLALARRLQFSLVRHNFDDLHGVNVFAGFFPCEAVGGDIYDCFEIDGKLIAYVADVSGHGVMPAMLAVFVTRTIKQICEAGELHPAEILRKAQEQFSRLDIDESIYITAFIISLDVASGTLLYSNAGLSVAPLLYDSNGLKELYLPSQPICRWFAVPRFASNSLQMEPGGRLLMYTDGIYRTFEKKFSQKRIAELLTQPEFEGKAFIKAVRSRLNARLKDDLTVFLCEWTGTNT